VTDLAHQLGYFATIADWRDWLTVSDRLAALTPEAVHQAARKYLQADNRTIGIFERCKPAIAEDVVRLAAVRAAVGDGFELMIDANQAFTVAEACRRAHAYRDLALAWFEEPLPAEDLSGHVELAAKATMPIAIGESLYHPAHFREYLERRACTVVQVDCARIGGITPWLKVAHLAETFNVPVCPHFLMELHVSLSAAVPNGAWVEYIPQLDDVTTSRMTMADGHAIPPAAPGLGIDWDVAAIDRLAAARVMVDR